MRQIEVKPYLLPFATPYRWAKGVQHARSGLIVRAEEEGAIGWGEAALPPHIAHDGEELAAACRKVIDEAAAMSGPFLSTLDSLGAPRHLRCGIASAWLSARAARAGQSLARYLAGSGHDVAAQIPVNALITDDEPQACVARAAKVLPRGEGTLKVKCSGQRKLDLERVEALRQAFPGAVLRLDANQSWSLQWVLPHLTALAAFDISYVEDPLPPWVSLNTYCLLRQESPVMIAIDEPCGSRMDAQAVLDAAAADVLVLKPQALGGPDVARDVIEAAAARGVDCVISNSIETAVGLHVALHCAALLRPPVPACGLGTARFFAEDLAEPPPLDEDGAMAVPTVPGLGAEPERWWNLH